MVTSPPYIPPLLIKERGERLFKRGSVSLWLSGVTNPAFNGKNFREIAKPFFWILLARERGVEKGIVLIWSIGV